MIELPIIRDTINNTCIPNCGECCHKGAHVSIEDANGILIWARDNNNVKKLIASWDNSSIKCPFLESDARCSIYEVRPYICKLFGHTEAHKCPKDVQFDQWPEFYNSKFISGLAAGATTTEMIAIELRRLYDI